MKIKFFIVFSILLFCCLSAVSANDLNETGCTEMDYNQTVESTAEEGISLNDSSESNSSVEIEKTTPEITLKTNKIKSKDSLNIYLKNSSGSPLVSKKLTVSLNNREYSIKTNSMGMATLNTTLPANTYVMSVSFAGDNQYNSTSKEFKVIVSKLDTNLAPYANFILKGKNLYVDLKSNENPLSSKKISIKINGKTYSRKTDKNGRASLKVDLKPSTYSVVLKYGGDNYYKSCVNKFDLRIMDYTLITIGNSKLLTNGYLRVYLKGYSTSQISHKNLIIKIADKKFTKKTNSEGIIVIKPKLGADEYNVIVKYGKYWTSKKVKCIEGDVKDPLKEKVSLKNGVPDIDVMPGTYVMGDGSATYTLTKSQYREVIKRDSYCLYLNNKLSKYTFFKTKSNPNVDHIIKREKWNVIERNLNTILVKANKYKYWPSSITVSLKGKSYTYSEVRDVQNTEYTCGPTSASVCSQVLRNFISEKYLAINAGSKEVIGTSCYWIMYALGKDFNCTYFYKSSFNSALKELQKGGCALIFHTKNHYVAILDISKDGKNVLVSNSYGDYYNIPTKWLTVKYMKTRFIKGHEDSIIVKLNYTLSASKKQEINNFYNSMGTNWVRQNTNAMIGFT